jgi:hypothetical protein
MEITINEAAERELAEFETWWTDHGQYCRAGGGDYEKTFAYRSWQAARATLPPASGDAVGYVEAVDLPHLIACIADGTKTAIKMYSFSSEERGITVPIYSTQSAPEVQASHGAVVGTVPRMAEFKTDDLVRRGYRKVGYILTSEDGKEYALSDSSVRWLTQPQYWRLMHEQDGSLFAMAAQASADSAAEDCTLCESMGMLDGSGAICPHCDGSGKEPDSAADARDAVDLSTLPRYEMDIEYGDYTMCRSSTGGYVLLADVEKLLAAIQEVAP